MSFKRQILYVLITLIICNIIPNCAGYKTEITSGFAMTPDITALKIVSLSPQTGSNKERFFVDVKGVGFESGSRLVIKDFVVGNKYVKITGPDSLIVRVPKGVPAGKYPVLIKNPDGKTSNEVWFEVRS